MVLKTVETQHDIKYDWLKWLVVSMLLIAGIVANYHYNYQPWPIRFLGGLLVMVAVVAIALQTYQGKQALLFARESRMELRKVFWPTLQETAQTTLIVAIMVIVLAVLLLVIDDFLMWLIGWLTGQRG